MHPGELQRREDSARFDPLAEGAHYALSRELALAIWARVRADATDGAGHCNIEQAQQRFHELGARIQARGGRLHPEVGRLTRVQTELLGVAGDAWDIEGLAVRTPGRETLVGGDSSPGLGFDDYRVLGLKDALQRLGPAPSLRAELVASAALADRSVAGRATRWREPLSTATTPNGHALWHAAERRAATLYRRAVAAGEVEGTHDSSAVEAALQRSGSGQPLSASVRGR
jgi:hypothetical protein